MPDNRPLECIAYEIDETYYLAEVPKVSGKAHEKDGVPRPKLIDHGDDKDCAATCDNGAFMHPVVDTVHYCNKHDCGPKETTDTRGVDYYGHARCAKVVTVVPGHDFDKPIAPPP